MKPVENGKNGNKVKSYLTVAVVILIIFGIGYLIGYYGTDFFANL